MVKAAETGGIDLYVGPGHEQIEARYGGRGIVIVPYWQLWDRSVVVNTGGFRHRLRWFWRMKR
jgi:hypothetical protein